MKTLPKIKIPRDICPVFTAEVAGLVTQDSVAWGPDDLREAVSLACRDHGINPIAIDIGEDRRGHTFATVTV